MKRISYLLFILLLLVISYPCQDVRAANTGQGSLIRSVEAYVTPPQQGITADYDVVFPEGAHYHISETFGRIYWNDLTDGTNLSYPSGVFKAAYQYEVSIPLVPDEGYAFDSAVAGMINDTSAAVHISNGILYLSYTFPIVIGTVSQAGLNIREPQAGYYPPGPAFIKTPDPERDPYVIADDGITWYELPSMTPLNNERLKSDTAYLVKVRLLSKEYYRFYSGLTAQVNGKTANVSVSGDLKEAVISYTFQEATIIAPYITYSVDQKVPEGSTVKLFVNAIGGGISYQWYYRNSSSDTWKKSIMACAKTDTFSFTAELNHSGHQYKCVVSNRAGTKETKPINLTVTPKIITQPKSLSAAVGTTAKFTVAAKGTNLSYQWYYRNNASDDWKMSTMASGKTATFTFTAEESHSGHQYRCLVSNGKGSLYTDTVAVTVTPRITTQPKSMSVAVGTTARFSVAAKGSNLTYQWYYRNNASDGWKMSTMACGKTAVFSFTAQETHSGHQYRCVISNGKGTISSNIVEVTVTPRITVQPKSAAVSAGTTVKFTVTAQGTGLSYQWYYRNNSSDNWRKSIMACGKTSVFSFTAEKSHSGHQYRCVVTGKYGETVSNTVTLTVK